ncbi:MAG: hypothetical protein Q8O00_09430 [Holophaga sp.]|nr:hypothetical protein [Holophaga sp.]
MNALNILLLLIIVLVGLWVAYKIGKIILRVLVGLLFIALLAFAIHNFLLAKPPTSPRSHYGNH